MLACDIDGTILAPGGELRPAVRGALRAVATSGVEVVLVTGRSPWSGIEALAAELCLTGPQVTMQGALVSDPATGAVQRARVLPPTVYLDTVRLGDQLGLDPIVALLDGHRAERLPDGIDLFVAAHEGPHFRYAPDLAALVTQRPIRVFLPTGPERHRATRRWARERLGPRASVVWGDLTGIEILAPGTNKGEAIGWLAAERGIRIEEVAAVGDATNDTEMLRVAGRSAAMGSAPREVRAAADVVVPSSADDGVLDALAWFFPDLTGELPRRPTAALVRPVA